MVSVKGHVRVHGQGFGVCVRERERLRMSRIEVIGDEEREESLAFVSNQQQPNTGAADRN